MSARPNSVNEFDPTRRAEEDMEFTNGERACRAHLVLEYYKHQLLGGSDPVEEWDVHDLIADLLHYCHREKINHHSAWRMGLMHWEAER